MNYFICKYLLSMELIDFPIERINEFLKDHVFEVTTNPTHGEDNSIKTNVKVKLTGVSNYISVGRNLPYIQYTLYIIGGDEESNLWYSFFAKSQGTDVRLTTTSREYFQITRAMNELLGNFLNYFGVEKGAICTRVINEIPPFEMPPKLGESLTNRVHKEPKKIVFEDVVRDWFKRNPNKYNLNSWQKEIVIQKILTQK